MINPEIHYPISIIICCVTISQIFGKECLVALSKLLSWLKLSEACEFIEGSINSCATLQQSILGIQRTCNFCHWGFLNQNNIINKDMKLLGIVGTVVFTVKTLPLLSNMKDCAPS